MHAYDCNFDGCARCNDYGKDAYSRKPFVSGESHPCPTSGTISPGNNDDLLRISIAPIIETLYKYVPNLDLFQMLYGATDGGRRTQLDGPYNVKTVKLRYDPLIRHLTLTIGDIMTHSHFIPLIHGLDPLQFTSFDDTCIFGDSTANKFPGEISNVKLYIEPPPPPPYPPSSPPLYSA